MEKQEEITCWYQHLKIYKFDPGEIARIKRNRYYCSGHTKAWMDGYSCIIDHYNKSSVTVIIKGYENERHRIDIKDLIPVK